MDSRNRNRNTLAVTKRRILLSGTAFLLFLSYLFFQLFRIQVFQYEYYRQKVYDQITTTSALKAERGKIYDSNLNLLATVETVWRVFVSSRDIRLYSEENGRDYAAEIAEGLGDILSLDKTQLLTKIQNSNVLDITIKKNVDKEHYTQVLNFIRQSGFENLVFTEAQTSRYYPNDTLFAHVLGFTGSDNQGLYGLEYEYESELKGTDGYYLYAKDANGNVLPTEYATYIPPVNGNTLITTLDSYVQQQLESTVEEIRENHAVENRVCGIVMDVKTGGILAMATSSPFNPNDPYELSDFYESKLEASGYAEGSEEYAVYRRELMEIMWSNKAVSETYEPGSTFKIITVSEALGLGVATINDTFSCHGYYEVGGWRIRCHKTTGHGNGFTLAYGLQMSCNPTMIQLAERIGAENFYDYFEKFGYLRKTGIDLPSEARTIFHEEDALGSTELATAAFGQRFKVTVINHLTAIAAVANGGVAVTPHIVDQIINPDGNIVYQWETPEENRIVSAEVAAEVAAVLEEGVSGTGGARNAAVTGYKIAAKTGTSQKFDVLDDNGNSYLRIGSTVAFAPSDDSGIAVIIVVDEPTCAVKYGSVVAAPYVSSLLADILPYLGYNAEGTDGSITLDNYVGLSLASAKSELTDTGLSVRVIGDGDIVISQIPAAGETVTASLSGIILYTENAQTGTVRIPNLVGMSAAEANKVATDAGFSLHIVGILPKSWDETVVVCSQSPAAGESAAEGAVLTLTVFSQNDED